MYVPIEDTEVCGRASELSDWIYRLVRQWDEFDRDTIGKQLVRAADSVGANLVEGDGRRSDVDSVRFFRYARSSAREARWWIRRAVARQIICPERGMELISELTICAKMTNGLIRFRSTAKVKEALAVYDDPLVSDS